MDTAAPGGPPRALLGSVVVPAHNEAACIARCLGGLRAVLDEGLVEVVVVSNGSHDDTVALATGALRTAPHHRVLDLPEASKAAALRAGDREAHAFPRVFLDADVRVGATELLEVLAALAATPEPRVAAPRLVMETAHSNAAVRAYHRVWSRLPYAAAGVIGTGFYAVNEAGARRLGEFPDVLNDDEWVRRHFGPAESIVTDGEFRASAPRTASALVRQRARTELGNLALHEHGGPVAEGAPAGRSTSGSDLLGLARSPRGAVDVGVYVALTLAARLLAAVRRRRGTTATWSTDATSRRLAAATEPTTEQTTGQATERQGRS